MKVYNILKDMRSFYNIFGLRTTLSLLFANNIVNLYFTVTAPPHVQLPHAIVDAPDVITAQPKASKKKYPGISFKHKT